MIPTFIYQAGWVEEIHDYTSKKSFASSAMAVLKMHPNYLLALDSELNFLEFFCVSPCSHHPNITVAKLLVIIGCPLLNGVQIRPELTNEAKIASLK